MIFIIPIILAITNLIAGFTAQQSTAVHPTVYIQESVSGTGDLALRQAIRFDGRYTDSRLVIHKCDTSHYCIRVRYGTPTVRAPQGYTVQAETSRGARTALITINPATHLSYTVKVRMYEHELGHAFGLGHNPRCTSLMYYALHCGNGYGKVSPQKFTAAERRILAVH